MLFTFIIPIYNSSTEVTSLLKRISSLTKDLDCEILIVDDCSHDGTYEQLIKEINGQDKVKLFRTPVNNGPGSARNLGISMAHGKYISFIDYDDDLQLIDNIVTNPEFFILRDHKAIDVICMRRDIQTRKHEQESTLPLISEMGRNSSVRLNISYENFPAIECWGVLFSSDFIKRNNLTFPPLMLAEDQVFMIKVRLKLRTIARTRLFNYIHIARADGLATRFEKRGLSAYSDVVKIILNLINTDSGSNLDFLAIKLRKILEVFFWFSFAFYEDGSREEIKAVFNMINKKKSTLEFKKISPFINLKEFVSFRQLLLNFITTNSKGLNLYCLSSIAMSVAYISERLKVPVLSIIDDERVKQTQTGNLKFVGQLRNSTFYGSGSLKTNHTVLICHSNKGIVRKIFLKLRDTLDTDSIQIFALSDFNYGPYLVK
jgi:glycosyltransferase involved in cell wall biosynthesis